MHLPTLCGRGKAGALWLYLCKVGSIIANPGQDWILTIFLPFLKSFWGVKAREYI